MKEDNHIVLKLITVPTAFMSTQRYVLLFALTLLQSASGRVTFLPSHTLVGSSIINLSTTQGTTTSVAKKYLRTKTFSPNEVAYIIDTTLFPKDQYKERLNIARDSQFSTGLGGDKVDSGSLNNNLISASDPRLSFTYDEFPVQSMDQLLDIAVDEYQKSHNGQKPKVLVDLGSGCGRLVLYAALCHKDCEDNLIFEHIHGIEISEALHEVGVKALDIGVKQGYFSHCSQDYDDGNSKAPTVTLHQGDANDLSKILHQADVVFTYSTVFDTKGFDEKLGAMILSDEWSKMLANVCRKGCIAVTTDRALNPHFGWELQSSLDVENPKLFGTTGYISKLQ